MSTFLGSALPQQWYDLLAGGHLFRSGGKAVAVLTVDGENFPHVAFVSGVAATAPDRLRVPLHAGTGTLANAERSGRLTVLISDRDVLLFIKGRLLEVHAAEDAAPGLRLATVTVAAVYQDMEEGLRVESGIRYGFPDPAAPGARMDQAILAALVQGNGHGAA